MTALWLRRKFIVDKKGECRQRQGHQGESRSDMTLNCTMWGKGAGKGERRRRCQEAEGTKRGGVTKMSELYREEPMGGGSAAQPLRGWNREQDMPAIPCNR